MRMRLFIALGLSTLSLSAAGRGGEWPQFRGPNGSAVVTQTGLPAEWGAGKNVAWKAKIPGYGWSSPIVWGNKVFLTTAVSDKQRKPAPGFGGPERPVAGGPGRGGPGGFRGGFRPAQVLPSFLQDRLSLAEEQKTQLQGVQKEVDGKLAKILSEEQQKILKEPPDFSNGFRNFALPGQLLAPAAVERLKPGDEQKKQLQALQKDIDTRLAKLLNAEQKKQLEQMREGMRNMGRGGPGGFGGFGGRPPDAVYKWEVYCLDRVSGKVLWKRLAHEGKPRIPTQASNTYASETPVTDGERLYAYFGMHGVYCYDLDGKLLWKKDLGSYPTALGFGTGASPALADGRLFIQCDNEKQSFLIALDAKTGEERWHVDRPERTGYSTPLIWKNKVRTEVVCLGSPRVRSYDPTTGKQLWELGGMSGQAKASPVASSELLYVGTGGGPGGFGRPGGQGPGERSPGSRPLVAVKAGVRGDITLKTGAKSSDAIAWSQPNAGPQTASPLLYEGYLYILEEHGGLVSCYNAQTGEKMYKERLPRARSFTSSPWAYDDKVFCLDDNGTTYVLKAGPEFQVLGTNAVEGMCWSSVAVADGAVLLRTVDQLYCFKDRVAEK